MRKKNKALVFFSAGVGDSIILVPLVNELRKNGYDVTGLFNSPFECESIFENTLLFDSIKVRKSKLSLILFALFRFRKFNAVFLNNFSYSLFGQLVSAIMGKQIFTNHKIDKLSFFSNFVHFREPKNDIPDALQNMLLFNQEARIENLDFNLHFKNQQNNKFKLPSKYIVVQVSSANNKAPFKNWPFNNWLRLFQRLSNTNIVLLGDKNEIHLNNSMDSINYPNVISLIGRTKLNDVLEIISRADFYVGLDSGLMHMAVALDKPTFTIWGASNPKLYGYDWKGSNHKSVSLNLPCSPCSSWLNPNISRVSNPLSCPDFKCINDLSVELVIKELYDFLQVNRIDL